MCPDGDGAEQKLEYTWVNGTFRHIHNVLHTFLYSRTSPQRLPRGQSKRTRYDSRGLKQDDDDGSENVAKKINWTLSICQKQATFPEVEFLRILFKFKKRNESSSWHVHVLHKTANYEFSRRSRAEDVKEMY